MGGVANPHHHHHHLRTKKLATRTIYILIPSAFFLHFFFFPKAQPTHPDHPSLSSSTLTSTPKTEKITTRNCNYTDGKWIRTNQTPFYNSTSCQSTIKPNQNCILHGRPDSDYLAYTWQPNHCALQPFTPVAFLDLIRNKHLAFIGDSMARNQLESLICMLSSAYAPDLVHRESEDNGSFKFRRWHFSHHNATVSVHWSPFLVKGVEKSVESGLDHNRLFLDVADDRWASESDDFDVVVFSVGHWFLHPAVFYQRDRVVGCHHCPTAFNGTAEEVGFFDVFRKAIRTSLGVVGENNRRKKKRKFVVVTTFSPAHFEGEWDRVGACDRKEPYGEGEKEMEYMDAEMRKIELEEVAVLSSRGEEDELGIKFEALDVTRLAMMRPDGHPGPYMNPDPFKGGLKERVQNDCVHWCLPGPIDNWNLILFDMIKRWHG